jgi:hypothetical protein
MEKAKRIVSVFLPLLLVVLSCGCAQEVNGQQPIPLKQYDYAGYIITVFDMNQAMGRIADPGIVQQKDWAKGKQYIVHTDIAVYLFQFEKDKLRFVFEVMEDGTTRQIGTFVDEEPTDAPAPDVESGGAIDA